MFWSKKKIDDDKEKQIRDLKLVFPSVRRPNNDDTLFEIKFVVDNQFSSLRIFIPADFPLTRPVLQVAGPVTHPWLDNFKQVNGCGKLMNWSKSSSLVEVVEESMSALLTGVNGPSTNTAASLVQQPSGNVGALGNNSTAGYHNPMVTQYSAMPSPTHSTTYSAAPVIQQQQQQNGYGAVPVAQHQHYTMPSQNFMQTSPSAALPAPASLAINKPSGRDEFLAHNNSVKTPISMPEVPTSFPDLEKLTDLQLERLLNDEVAFQANLGKLASMESMGSLRDQMRLGNSQQASNNLELEQEVAQLARQAEEAREKFSSALDAYSSKLSGVSKQYEVSKQDVFSELENKRDRLDERSEELGRSFVEGKVELGAFVQEYMEVRSSYHSLASKMAVANQQ